MRPPVWRAPSPPSTAAPITASASTSRSATAARATIRWRSPARAGADVVTTAPGRGGQLAAGAAAGGAPWLLFLHADTMLGTGWADAVRRFMAEPRERAREPATSGCGSIPAIRAPAGSSGSSRWRCRTFGLPYGDQGLLMARDFYRRLGGFRSAAADGGRRPRAPHRPGQPGALDADVVASAATLRTRTAGCCVRCATCRASRCISAGVPLSVVRRLYDG